jgi:arginine decarboxylase-like protein
MLENNGIFGLEAGSKPELMAALALHNDFESLIICNGGQRGRFGMNALAHQQIISESLAKRRTLGRPGGGGRLVEGRASPRCGK